MTLILGDVRPHRRQFGDLMAVNILQRGVRFDLLWQNLAAVAAIGRQYGNDLIDALYRHQLAVSSRMSWLSSRLALAALAGRFLSRRSGGPVGGWGLGRVGGIFLPAGELALQFGNLLFRLGKLFFRLGYLVQ